MHHDWLLWKTTNGAIYGLTQSFDQSSDTKNGTDAEAWHCGQWLSAHNPQCPSESQRAS